MPWSRARRRLLRLHPARRGTVLAIVGDVSGKEIPKPLEAGPMTLGQVLGASAERSAAGRSPGEICDDLLRAAAADPGPVGVPDWQDDRTVFVFAVEPAP